MIGTVQPPDLSVRDRFPQTAEKPENDDFQKEYEKKSNEKEPDEEEDAEMKTKKSDSNSGVINFCQNADSLPKNELPDGEFPMEEGTDSVFSDSAESPTLFSVKNEIPSKNAPEDPMDGVKILKSELKNAEEAVPEEEAADAVGDLLKQLEHSSSAMLRRQELVKNSGKDGDSAKSSEPEIRTSDVKQQQLHDFKVQAAGENGSAPDGSVSFSQPLAAHDVTQTVKTVQDMLNVIHNRIRGEGVETAKTLDMELQVDQIGKLNLSITRNGGELKINIQTGDDGAKSDLNSQRDDIQRQMMMMGYTSVSVDIGGGRSDSSRQESFAGTNAESVDNVRLAGNDELDRDLALGMNYAEMLAKN